MTKHRYLCLILSLTLLLTSLPELVWAYTLPDAEPVLQETLQGVPGATDDWWATVQGDLRRSEYYVTWQERTYLVDVDAAYQAPNRAHNLRIYFTPQGMRVIPRVFEGNVPPWEWGLALTGYGTREDVRPVEEATLSPDAGRIEYQRGDLTEWYVNDEHGLEQGFTLRVPPFLGGRRQRGDEGEIVLDLVLGGNLTPKLTGDRSTIEFTTPGGVRVLRYGELAAYDAAGRQLPTSLSLFPGKEGKGGVRITFDATVARYPITIDPQVTGLSPTPDWTAEGDQNEACFGSSVGAAGDVNGDGYSDVIVGAPLYDNGQMDEGQAYVYHGSATGLSLTADWAAESDQTEAYFGDSVGTAGDVNGDGYSDVIVGAPLYDNGQTDEGQAYVYHGSATGLSLTADWTAESDQTDAHFGSSVGTAGDVNGDGYSDVIVGAPLYDNGQTDEGRAYVYHGMTTGLSLTANWTAESDQTDAWLGTSTGTAGDVNGDGYADAIVGAYNYDNGQVSEGRAFVYHGSATGLSLTVDWSAESDQDYAYFGYSAGTAGDVNGDGYSDVIVGAYLYSNSQTNEGRAFVYHGSATGLSLAYNWSAEGDQDFAKFGYSVSTAGDVNGDGYADVIVGAPWYDSYQGQTTVYHGSATGLSLTYNWTAVGDQGNAELGDSVGTAGDVNGDGYSDVIVGAHLYNAGQTQEGRAYAYHGAANGLAATAGWTVAGDQVGDELGTSVGTAGDVNGDGYADVIVSGLYYDNGTADEGQAHVYHGSATGLSLTADWTAGSDQGGTYFGRSVGTAGDVNGDGYSDVIVGEPGYNSGEWYGGRAYVYHGSATGLSPTPSWTAEGDQEGAWFGWSVGTAGDVNGDGFSDVIVGAPNYNGGRPYEGRVYVYYGSATGLSLAHNWTAESGQDYASFSVSVGTAGDVNGDGFSDVIVGAPTYDGGQENEGWVFIYYGSAAGLSFTHNWTAEGDQADAQFGTSVGTAGDVDDDGFSDVIVGARYYDNGQEDEGGAFVYHGSATGLSPTPAWTAEGDQTNAYFGDSVGTAGDVNSDGYADVIVGAHGYDNGQADQGRAGVYHGSATGLATTANWTAEGDQAGDGVGRSVGTAGDVNGDGYADVIVGAPFYAEGGQVFLYYGNGGDGLHLLPQQARSDGSAPIAHLGMSDSGTAFQLSLIGRMPLGREEVKLQWQVAPLGIPFGDPSVIEGSSPAWIDTGTDGIEISQTIGGLAPDTPYHWRARLLYRPGNVLGQPAGRWVHIPWNGWNETDLRTAQEYSIYLPMVVCQVP